MENMNLNINAEIASAVEEMNTASAPIAETATPVTNKPMKKMTCYLRFVNTVLPANGDKTACVYTNCKRIYKGEKTMIEVKCVDEAYDAIMALNATAKQRLDLKVTFEGRYWVNDRNQFCFKAYKAEFAQAPAVAA